MLQAQGLDFFSFGLLNHLLRPVVDSTSDNSLFRNCIAGALAGMLSTCLFYPLDILRVRISAPGPLRGIRSTMMHIMVNEGALAVFRGLPFALLSIAPESAITYGLFAALSKGDKPSLVRACASGVAAASVGQAVSFPLEAIARRLATGKYASVRSAALAIMRDHDSVLGFWAGLPTALGRVLPMAVVSFATYAFVRRLL